jgi:hypothetical protein
VTNIYRFPTPIEADEDRLHAEILTAINSHMPAIVRSLAGLTHDLAQAGAMYRPVQTHRLLAEVLVELIRDELAPEARRVLDEHGWPA